MIGTTIRQYRIKSELTPGKGGMGDLYLAEHVSLPKRFAVKCVKPALTQDPQFCKRFFQEAQDQALLDHPNIVQAVDFFEEGGQFFFVMQFIQGQDLDNLIKAKKQLAEREALRIFEGILEGLKFAHEKGVVHRDMKPSNVLIDEGGRPRITDFGIAIIAGVERLTATGTAIGTPWYMSPEQIKSPKNVDCRSDIYSAGIVLYEMLTGDVPFDGETDFSIKEQQVGSPAPNPRLKNPAIAPELAEIILKALAKNPQDRFQSCEEMLARIQAYRRTSEPVARPKARWLLWGAAILAAGSIIGIGLALYFRTVPTDTGVNETAQRDLALVLVRDIAERAAIACRELQGIQPLENIRSIARDQGRTAVVDEYTRQIEDRRKNLANLNSEFRNSILKLAKIKPGIADSQFQVLGDELLKGDAFGKLKFLRLAQLRYQQAVSNQNGELLLDASACASNP